MTDEQQSDSKDDDDGDIGFRFGGDDAGVDDDLNEITASMAAASSMSVWKLNRLVKRRELCLLYRLLSIKEDADFVDTVRARHASFTCFANRSCGSWYVRPNLSASPAAASSLSSSPPASSLRADECYFKSADGHTGNWVFSLSRLNVHVAAAAVRDAGCIIVDSTRNGKRFPDSFSRTIPIWCCIVNRAVAAVRRRQAAISDDSGGDAADAGGGCDDSTLAGDGDGRHSAVDACAWDAALHLPSWVSPSEASQIEAKLDAWVHLLVDSGVDLNGVAATLRRPLRPLWLSQASATTAVTDYSFAAFTPLLLVSCSHAEQHGSGERRGWCYVQGAGDDAEHWSRGLTPRLLWQHQHALLVASADDCNDAAAAIVAAAGAPLVATKAGQQALQSPSSAPLFSADGDAASAVHVGCAPEPLTGDDGGGGDAGSNDRSSGGGGGVVDVSLLRCEDDAIAVAKLAGDTVAASPVCASFDAIIVVDDQSGSATTAVATETATTAAVAASMSATPRAPSKVHVLLVAGKKNDKNGLLRALPAAIQFVASAAAAVTAVAADASSTTHGDGDGDGGRATNAARVTSPTTSVRVLVISVNEEMAAATAAALLLAVDSASPTSPALTKAAVRARMARILTHTPAVFPKRGLYQQLNRLLLSSPGSSPAAAALDAARRALNELI
jgi:hypothetical protein